MFWGPPAHGNFDSLFRVAASHPSVSDNLPCQRPPSYTRRYQDAIPKTRGDPTLQWLVFFQLRRHLGREIRSCLVVSAPSPSLVATTRTVSAATVGQVHSPYPFVQIREILRP